MVVGNNTKRKNKNILFIDRRIGFNRGGGEVVNLSLARELTKRGHKIFFLIGADRQGKMKIPFQEFPFFQANSPYLVNLWQKLPFPFSVIINYLDLFLFKKAVLQKIHQIIKDQNITVIQVLGMPDLAYALQKKLPNLRIVTQFPGPPGKFIYLNQIKKLKYTFAPGDAFRQLKKINSRAKHIPNGIDQEKFDKVSKKRKQANFLRQGLQIDEDKIIVLSVGRLVPLKDYPLLFKVVKELKKKTKKFICLIIGDGPLREKLENLIEEYALEDHVKLLGAVDHNKIAKYFCAADLFLLTSKYESSSIVVLEAMYSRLPVVVANVGGVTEFVIPEKTGFLVNNRQPESFVRALVRLIDDPEYRYQIGQQGYQKAKKYTWARSAQLFEKYFLRF